MFGLLARGQGQVHGVRAQFAHHLRSDIAERDELFGQIFELGTRLAQRRFRHHGVGFSDDGIPVAALRRNRARFKPRPCRNNTVSAAERFDRLIFEIVDSIDCGAKLGAFGFKGSDLRLECVALAIRSDPEGSKFVFLRPQPDLKFSALAFGDSTKRG
jgi:hypothetical protein